MGKMKKLTIYAVMLLMMSSANASLETDRIAGECAGLLTALNKPAMAAEALGMADRLDRATKFAYVWMDKVKGYAGKDYMINGMVSSATSDCRKIGIRASE